MNMLVLDGQEIAMSTTRDNINVNPSFGCSTQRMRNFPLEIGRILNWVGFNITTGVVWWSTAMKGMQNSSCRP